MHAQKALCSGLGFHGFHHLQMPSRGSEGPLGHDWKLLLVASRSYSEAQGDLSLHRPPHASEGLLDVTRSHFWFASTTSSCIQEVFRGAGRPAAYTISLPMPQNTSRIGLEGMDMNRKWDPVTSWRPSEEVGDLWSSHRPRLQVSHCSIKVLDFNIHGICYLWGFLRLSFY